LYQKPENSLQTVSTVRPLTEQTRDFLNQVICALAVVAAVVACQPFVEAGFNDDWSYSHIAVNFARTGHMAYDGWCSPTILVQAFLGKLLISRFGFSFELLRFVTLPFAMGCGVLCYRLGRMAGLTTTSSLFGSLAFVMSPLFIPLAASFMTDVYGCFFMLLSFYCGVIAGEASLSIRQRIWWLSASVLVGYVGGLDRQTVYVAPGAVLLWAIWRWRRDRAMTIATGCLLAALGAGAYLAVRWQALQPLGAGEIVTYPTSWKSSAFYPVSMILTLTLLLLPAVVRFGNGRWRIPIRFYAISLLFVLGAFTFFWRAAHRLLFPWQVNFLTQFGFFQDNEVMSGHNTAVLNHNMRIAVTVVVLAVLIRVIAVLLDGQALGDWDLFRKARRLWRLFWECPAILQMSGIFAAVYTGLLIFQARLVVFDRYLIPLMPLALIAALLFCQKMPGKPLTVLNWSFLTLFALYGVAIAHDYFAALQARVSAFERVEAQGIPRTQISGGFELDGWTQVEAARHVGYPSPEIDLWNQDPTRAGYWFLHFTPNIDPLYYLAWSEATRGRSHSLPAVPFGTWLPPFRREIKILKPSINE
jgi:hypothetical protein